MLLKAFYSKSSYRVGEMPGSGVRKAIHELGVCVMVVHLTSTCKALGSVHPQHQNPQRSFVQLSPVVMLRRTVTYHNWGTAIYKTCHFTQTYPVCCLVSLIYTCVCAFFYMLTPIQFHHLCRLRHLSPQTR